MVIDLKELQNLRIIDLRELNISESYRITSTQYPPRFYQTVSRMTYNLITDKDIQDFKIKAVLNHADCMTIDNYGLTAYVKTGLELKY